MHNIDNNLILINKEISAINSNTKVIAVSIRRILMFTRASHELIWGLLLLQMFGKYLYLITIH